jgi:hypothetical protein
LRLAEEDQYLALHLEHLLGNGYGVFKDKSTKRAYELPLRDAREVVVIVNEEDTYPLHRHNWNRLCHLRAIGASIEVAVRTTGGMELAYMKDLVAESLDDLYFYVEQGLITPRQAIRLAHKMGQTGSKVFIRNYKNS